MTSEIRTDLRGLNVEVKYFRGNDFDSFEGVVDYCSSFGVSVNNRWFPYDGETKIRNIEISGGGVFYERPDFRD